mgnify:CR=1 FL=1
MLRTEGLAEAGGASALIGCFDKEDYMLKLSHKKRKACLALAVAAAVLGANNAFAASVEHDKAIYESNNYGSSMRTYWQEQGVYDADKHTYTFNEDISLKPKASEQELNYWTPIFGGLYVAGYNPVTIDMQGHRLDIAQNVDQVRVGSVHNIKAVSANGIHVTSSSLTINNVKGMNISAGGSFLSVGTVRGIYVAGTNQEGAYGDGKGLASLTINNADGWENAITFKSSQAQVENAIEVKKNTGTADLSISGMVDLYVGNDSDVITVSGGTSYYDINSTPTAYIGGGAIKAAMGRAGLISGGVLSINSKLQNGEMVATEGSRDVQVEGNFLVKDLQEDQGVLTLGMNTDKSYFKGTIFNENGSGDAYMLLQNGAQWTNVSTSKGDYDYHGSSLKQFVGGNGAASTGYIYQNDSATLNLGNYSGYTTIFYEHGNAGTETADYTAGNTIVDTAKAGSNITLITNNVDTNNDATVNAALNALAGKLYYNAAKRGDNALEGMAVIADGLTSSSKSLKTAGIYFNEETGQGSTTAVSPNTKRDFTTTLTGVKANDNEYADAGIIAEDGSYTFTKNSTITTEGEALNSSQTNIVILTQNDSSLSLASKGKKSVLASTLNIQNKGNVSITASELKVAMDGSESTAGITSGIQIGTMDTYLSRGNNVLLVKGDTTIDVTGKKAVMGIYSMTDSETVFDGNLKINVNNTTADTDATGILGHYHTNGIYAGFNDSTVTVKGDVDITVNGTGIQANKGGKVNVIGGGSVKIDRTDKADQYALEAEAAEISMNVATDSEGNVTGAGSRKVVLEGNLGVLDKSYGAAPNNDGVSVISLGLATEDSTWRGVAYNEYRENDARAEATQGTDTKDGKINLYLKQGSWINEAYGAVKQGFTGSKVNVLAGGNDAANAGNIFQNDSNKLTIDNYSGNTNIYYAHTGNGEAAGDYAAGDTIIKSAEKNSSVSLITDNKGVAMDNADSVANVLNALAGKLIYSNFTKGEKNLAGYVKIADGLTASSAAMKIGDITFNKEDGKGTYVKKEVVEKFDFTTALTGNKTKDDEYEGNIDSTGKYTFSKDSTITLANPEDNAGAITAERDFTIEAAKDLKLKVNGSNQNSYGLVQDAGKNVVIKAENLNVDISNNKGRADAIHVNGNSNGERGSLTLNGNLNMKATHDISADVGGAYTLGAYTYQADIVINGNVTSAIDAGAGVNAYYGASHLYASGATGEQKEGHKAGTLTVNGNVDLSGTAQGLFANIGGAVVTVNGGGKIILDEKAAKSNGYAAIRAENSTANMNVKLDAAGNATSGLGNDVVIKGNVAASVGAVNSIDKNGTMTRVNLALDTDKSSLQGAIVNGFDREDGTTGIDTEADEGGTLSKHFTGENNLWLQNGATWTNELYGKLKFFKDDKYKTPFMGSHVTNLTGGIDAAHSGYIIQNDRRTLTIDNYSGNTNIFYAHTGNGEATDNYAGGDTIIKHAAKDAAVTLITDNTGVNLNSEDSVTNVLNALAGKLYYNAYINNERNLAGTVSIADGLTASSFTKTYNSGDITFNDKTGQGSYVKAEVPVQTEFTTQIQGFAARDTEYVNAGITTGDQKYTFKKDSSITVGNKDAILGVAEIPADWVTTFEKTFKGVTVDAGENTLTLKTNQRAIYANANKKTNITSTITAGKLLITANETSAYRDAAFAVATGGVTLNINADIEGTVYGTNSASYGLYAEKDSRLTVNGDITAVKENGYGIDGKTVSKNYGIRVNDGTITVNGGVNMIVNGKAIAADKGTVNVNMNADLNGAADNAVILQGDVTASNGTVNLGLNTEASKLTGAVIGNVNLYLANGASWDNTGAASNVAKLAGGTGAAGNIFANSTNAMTIDNYSGNTNIYYAHTGNGEAAENYAAGDTIIKSAAEGSVVSMITDNNGIKMDSEDSVANVLNALAGKLTYSNFTKGEKNLAGYVKIADGLTASSAALKTENITFNSENGKGGYVKPEKPVQTEFTTQLQGFAARDTEYVNAGITTGDQKYTFKKDSSITVGNKDAILGVAEIPADWVTTFEKTFKGVTVDAGENTLTLKTNQRAIYANANKKPNITSNITAGKLLITANETSAYRDAAFAVATGSATLNINADIEGTVYGTNSASYGLYAEKGSKLTVNGDITAVKENGYGIDGKTVSKNYGIRVNDGTITVNGGVNMTVNGKAIAADKGTVNVNMNADLNGAADNAVILQGDVTASNGTVNLGLNTQSSKLTGAVSGNVNLYLANGASWDNTGAASNVAKLAGGASKAGNIFANSTNAMTIDNYSGNTNIYYAHTGNGEAAENYAAGDTIIKSAAEGSVVSMITDNNGIKMDSEDSVANVLNALAGKLTYSNFTKGEKNLAGYVKIADGLTASSAALKTENITFNSENGKGGYVKPEKPVQTEFTTQLQGFAARDTEYVNAGITTGDQKYTFKKDSSITVGNKDAILGVAEIPADWVTTFEKTFKGVTVDAGENTLTLKTNQRAIYANGNSKPNITSNITAGKLLITANETSAYRDAAFAVATGGATLNINADIEGTVYGTNSASYGLYAEKGSKLTVNGDITAVKKNGYGIDGKTVNKNYGIRVNDGTITVNGGVNMIVNGKAIAADKGTVNVNMNADLSGAADHTVILQGDVTASNGTVNLGLNTQSSKLTGAVSGNVNLYLANGASWDNTGAASNVAKLAGGASKAGNIFANSTNAMTIDNYSGNTNIYYAHTGNGEAASDYAAGDTIIKSAAEGSVVSMITDNSGIAMDNEYSVANVLNTLAGKLTYSNFTKGEKNLTGYVKIADGLTASSKEMQTGNIAFNAETGKGSLENGSMKPGFTYPETQKPEATEKNQGITGDAKTDYQYKKDGILKEDGKYVFTQDPTKIDVENGAAVEASTNDINIDTTKAKLELKGETGIKANGADVNVKGNTEISGNVGIDAANCNVTLNGSTTINANDGKGTAINAGEGGNVDINTNNSALNIKGDINANGGNITLDSGKATGTIEGNVNASNGGNVEISLNDKNSTITGSYNVDADSSIVMNIANGATWNLTDDEDDAAGMSLLRMAKAPAAAKGLTANGGKTEEETGYLNMTKRTKDLKIDHYSGWETVIYGHENAGNKVNDYKSGNTIINKAETGSGLILYTDNTGITMDDKKAVEAALAALAQKAQYNDHEANGGNLTGKVKIAEGMTAAGKIGSMRWDENGKGQYIDNSVNWKEIYNGNYETFVMQGVRSAATTSMHSWRDNMQDTYTGADLADADGIFAKALGGKTSSDVKGVKDDNTYRGVQVGLDKALANGWHAGVAFDYRNGDSNYLLGGKGDNQLYSLGVYGVKNFEDQSYLRVAAKAGRVENEYDVYNETRRLKLHGDYKSNAYGLTMEYGKTFGSEESYFTPKAQLTWSQVGSKDYTARTPNDSMRIDQDAYSSFVGRLGFEVGVKSEKGRIHAGMFAAHEFNGDISASYFAKDGGTKYTSFSGEDTWMEMSIGGSYDLSDNCHIYADFAKDFGGDFERKWKASAGLRFEF